MSDSGDEDRCGLELHAIDATRDQAMPGARMMSSMSVHAFESGGLGLANRSASIDHEAGEPAVVTLRRSGRQPIRFRGFPLVQATGHGIEGRIWHEVNIWRKHKGGYVADLRVFKKSPGEKDVFHAEACDSLAEVVAWLEAYDPTKDIIVNVETDNLKISTAQMTMKAVALRQRMEEAETLWRSMLGDLLYQLEMTDTIG